MLKKAGIVVAAAAAGLLAVSPLAFATTPGHHGDHRGDHGDRSHSQPVNVDYTNIQRDNDTNDCNFAQDGGDARSSAFAGGGLLSILNPAISAAAPVTANLNALNCNNIDVSRLVNVGSENGNTSDNVSRTSDSGNLNFGR
jgi:hypothetical protein